MGAGYFRPFGPVGPTRPAVPVRVRTRGFSGPVGPTRPAVPVRIRTRGFSGQAAGRQTAPLLSLPPNSTGDGRHRHASSNLTMICVDELIDGVVVVDAIIF